MFGRHCTNSFDCYNSCLHLLAAFVCSIFVTTENMAPRSNKKTSEKMEDKKKPPAKKPAPSLKQSPKSTVADYFPSTPRGTSEGAFASPSTASTISSSSGGTMSVASLPSMPAGVASPSASVLKSLFQVTKSNDAAKGLAAFGIKPADKGRNQGESSKLKVVIIPELGSSASLVFRCQPDQEGTVSWAEKTFFDAVRYKHDWPKTINVESQMLLWFHNNVPIMNPNGFGIRMFVIHCAERPTVANVLQLGQYIIENINEDPTYHGNITIDQDNFFWIPNLKGEDKPVWSDIIGVDKAIKELNRLGGSFVPGFYDGYRDLVHTYFRPHTFSFELARMIHAPLEQVHPELRQANELQIQNEDPMEEDTKAEPEDNEDGDETKDE